MFKVLTKGCEPTRGSKYSACVDLYASEDVVIGAGETKLIGLGDKKPNTFETNADSICRELTDVIAVLDELSESCGILLIPRDKTSDTYIEKRYRIQKYIDYSKEVCILDEG